jgi:hypothetical protein
MAGLVPAISIPDALRGIEIPGTRPGMTALLMPHITHPKRLPAPCHDHSSGLTHRNRRFSIFRQGRTTSRCIDKEILMSY